MAPVFQPIDILILHYLIDNTHYLDKYFNSLSHNEIFQGSISFISSVNIFMVITLIMYNKLPPQLHFEINNSLRVLQHTKVAVDE